MGTDNAHHVILSRIFVAGYYPCFCAEFPNIFEKMDIIHTENPEIVNKNKPISGEINFSPETLKNTFTPTNPASVPMIAHGILPAMDNGFFLSPKKVISKDAAKRAIVNQPSLSPCETPLREPASGMEIHGKNDDVMPIAAPIMIDNRCLCIGRLLVLIMAESLTLFKRPDDFVVFGHVQILHV